MSEPFSLLDLAYDGSVDGSSVRVIARRAAALLGLDDIACTRVATAVSELARLAGNSDQVRVGFAVDVPDGQRQSDSTLSVRFAFDSARRALTLPVQTAVSRLMDSVQISDDAITMRRRLPTDYGVAELAAVRDTLLRESSADQGALLQSLNDELVAALVELREREADLVQLNAELDHTNRGVVALYAELEQRSAEVRAAQRMVFEELEDALRPPPPELAAVELAVRYLPAQANSPTGGDLYDWFVLPSGTIHLTVVDVQGHGVTGTRDALHVTHAVRTLVLEGHALGEILSRADAILQSGPTGVVATALLAQLDPTTGTLQLAGAGHPPALHVHTAEPSSYLEAPGRPIGYEGGGSNAVSVVMLDPGDAVLLYTDGLIEIRRDILEGMDRLAVVATESRHLPLAGLLATTVAQCADGAELEDDTLLVGIRWTGPPVA